MPKRQTFFLIRAFEIIWTVSSIERGGPEQASIQLGLAYLRCLENNMKCARSRD